MKKPTLLLTLLLASLLLLGGFGGAMAKEGGASTTSARETSTDTEKQRVDIPRDNVLAALALGIPVRLEDVANIDRSATRTEQVERRTHLDENDVLLTLALQRRGYGGPTYLGIGGLYGGYSYAGHPYAGYGGPYGPYGGIGDVRLAEREGYATRQRVHLDDETVLAALALGYGGGAYGLRGIADLDRSVTQTRAYDRSADLERGDVIAVLALS